MLAVDATYTLEDFASPDLDAVTHHIAQERGRSRQSIRATALLHTLNRAWDRLRPQSRVRAVWDNYGWKHRGEIDAWWLSTVACTPWLPAADGIARMPHELRIRTASTEALYGDVSAQYVATGIDTVAYAQVLERLGVQGDPRPEEILDRLREVQDGSLDKPATAADLAAPLYSSLTAQLPGGGGDGRLRTGAMTMQGLRTEFNRGQGLVATNVGWRRPPVVRGGPPVLGDLVPFVPAVPNTKRLWAALGIGPPTAADAFAVLRKLSRRTRLETAHTLVMLDALRILAAAPPGERPHLRRSAVWVGDRWMTNRPVYAVSNPLIAAHAAAEVPLWAPGGTLSQLEELIGPYGLTSLDSRHVRVLTTPSGPGDVHLTDVFRAAVEHLREDLALSDPSAEQSLVLPWGDLLAIEVCITPELVVELNETTTGLRSTITPGAWIDLKAGTFLVAEPEEAGSPQTGAYAVAALFESDLRRVSHDWVVAWARAGSGVRARELRTARSTANDQIRRRATEYDKRLREIASKPKPQRSRLSGAGPTGRISAAAESVRPRPEGPKPAAPAARQLIDPGQYTLRDPSGRLVDGRPGTEEQDGGFVRPAPNRHRAAGLLAEPDPNNPKRPRIGLAARNYTAEELETLGLRLATWALGLDDDEVIDIRNQRNVGADAVDELRNFYELKVSLGPIPDSITLQESQVERALSTDQFFVVAVGNLEHGQGQPEVRIITDPLVVLRPLPRGAITLGGVRSAPALTFVFERSSHDATEAV